MTSLAGDAVPLTESLILHATGFQPRNLGGDELWEDVEGCGCSMIREEALRRATLRASRGEYDAELVTAWRWPPMPGEGDPAPPHHRKGSS